MANLTANLTLREISAEFTQALDMVLDTEVEEQELVEYLAGINCLFEDKADGYANLIQTLNNHVANIEEEEKRLSARKNALKNRVKKLKELLENCMRETGKTKFQTPLYSFSISKVGGKLPLILDVDVEELPEELTTVVKKPNNDEIRNYIETTGDISYAHFGERAETLRIK